MIETYNNIIFWIGYLTILIVLISVFVSMYIYIHEIFMNRGKTYFAFIFNNALDKKLKTVNKETFDKWQQEQLKQWVKYHKSDTLPVENIEVR